MILSLCTCMSVSELQVCRVFVGESLATGCAGKVGTIKDF